MAKRFQHSDDGVPYGFGNLSTTEIMSCAKKIDASCQIAFNINTAILSNSPCVLYLDKHYYLTLPCYDGYFIYDSLGPLHAMSYLGSVAVGHTNNITYQDSNSDTCGLFVLHALKCYSLVDKKSSDNVLLKINQYLGKDVVANEFNITVFGVCYRIGEEFNSKHYDYGKTRAMIMLCEG